MGLFTAILAILGLIFALAAIAALWLVAVWRVYRLNREEPEHIRVRTRDGWGLTLYHRKPRERLFEEPVLLCHGLAANYRNLDFEPPWSLAQYLADAGFECFSVDWRGTGRSRYAPKGKRVTDYNVDDHILEDAPAFIEEALSRTGARRVFWLGHSLGGLVGYGVAGTETAEKLAGIVTLGSPAFFRYPRYMHRIIRFAMVLGWPRAVRQRLFSVATAPFLGHIALPLTDVVFNPDHIAPREQRKIYAQVVSSVSFGVLKQFDGWLHGDCFCSMDGRVDYRAGMARMNVPLLVTGGSVDRLAPPEVVQSAWELAGSTDKTLMIFGTANGDRLDYGHGDLIFGVGAPIEVFPRIRTWLEARATRRSSTGSG